MYNDLWENVRRNFKICRELFLYFPLRQFRLNPLNVIRDLDCFNEIYSTRAEKFVSKKSTYNTVDTIACVVDHYEKVVWK